MQRFRLSRRSTRGEDYFGTEEPGFVRPLKALRNSGQLPLSVPRGHQLLLLCSWISMGHSAGLLALLWSKTQKARGDDVWIPRQEAPLDPVHAIHKHYIKNKLQMNHPIAAYRDTHGTLAMLTRSKFIRRINQILRATNKHYPRVTGHCFHIGGTTFYLVSGVPPDMVKKFGC